MEIEYSKRISDLEEKFQSQRLENVSLRKLYIKLAKDLSKKKNFLN
jgi:hypothetical protein